MSYDYDYFSGANLRYPTKPTKPTLGRNANSVEARAYADALEEYEREIESYNEDLNYYKLQKASRLQEFKDKIRDGYSLSQAQFDVLWRKAWEDGHSSGLADVMYQFESLHDVASEFAALNHS